MKKPTCVTLIYVVFLGLSSINSISAQTKKDNSETATEESISDISHLALASTTSPGADMVVDWSGPGKSDNAIYVVRVGETDILSNTSARADDFKPAIIKAPNQAGEYQMYLKSGTQVLANAFFTVLSAKPRIKILTPVVIVGEDVSIEWNGPRNSGDNLSVGSIGNTSTVSKRPASGSVKSTVSLAAPMEAGQYEVRLKNRAGAVLAKQAFEVR